VAVKQRAPRHHVIDEAIAVDVLDGRARGASNEQRRTPDGLERPNRAIDAAGEDLGRAGEKLL
jgi:hypothetical protein